jgi:hypothetical protein
MEFYRGTENDDFGPSEGMSKCRDFDHSRASLSCRSLLLPRSRGLRMPNKRADLNGDGVVSGEGLAVLLGGWGSCS